MSRSSVPTSLRSGLSRRFGVVSPASREDRLSALLILALMVAWFTYTRFYFWLQPRGLTFAPSLFMRLTGRPDPTCGLTRTFAWTWRGDLAHAVVVYPLGPLLFLAALALLTYSAAVLISGRSLRLNLSSSLWRSLTLGLALALGLNWAAKLLWLGI
jgi:hypothetical protein